MFQASQSSSFHLLVILGMVVVDHIMGLHGKLDLLVVVLWSDIFGLAKLVAGDYQEGVSIQMRSN